MQSYSGQSARRTLYASSTGDTTNPNADLLDLPLQDDEHFVADVATQQNGVPTNCSQGMVQPLRNTACATNLPADYDTVTPLQESEQQTQVKQASTESTQTTQIHATAIQVQPEPSMSTAYVTGENLSLQIEDGPYGPLLHYGHTDSNAVLFSCSYFRKLS